MIGGIVNIMAAGMATNQMIMEDYDRRKRYFNDNKHNGGSYSYIEDKLLSIDTVEELELFREKLLLEEDK